MYHHSVLLYFFRQQSWFQSSQFLHQPTSAALYVQALPALYEASSALEAADLETRGWGYPYPVYQPAPHEGGGGSSSSTASGGAAGSSSSGRGSSTSISVGAGSAAAAADSSGGWKREPEDSLELDKRWWWHSYPYPVYQEPAHDGADLLLVLQ